jgi:hypothetical protein
LTQRYWRKAPIRIVAAIEISGYPRSRLTASVKATTAAAITLIASMTRFPRRREKRAIASSPARKLRKTETAYVP